MAGRAAARRTPWEVNAARVETLAASSDAPPEELTLDFDAADDPAHGTREGRFFHRYHGGHCFPPWHAFRGSRPLVAYPRPRDIDASKYSRAVLKLLVGRPRRAWPALRITVRAHQGFRRWRSRRWRDRHRVDYVICLA